MKLVRLTPNNANEILRLSAYFQQILPFFSSVSEATTTFLAQLTAKSEQSQQMAFEKGGKLTGLVSFYWQHEELVITHFLVAKNQLRLKQGLDYWLKQLEKMVKLQWATSYSFVLPLSDYFLIECLKKQRIQMSQPNQKQSQWNKTVAYHTGLVLAGGGARGAYQIGAWRALKELDIPFDLICGTSVGALNGGMILQGDSGKTEKMWNEVDTGNILALPTSYQKGKYTASQMVKDVQGLAFSAIANQGVSTEPLRQLIATYLDEEKMSEQKPDLFLCTTEIPTLKEVVVSFKETPAGQFGQWLLASSSFFPAMAATKIDEHYYIDGGYRNNIPSDVALKKGATELIIIDVKGPGVTKPHFLDAALPVVTITSQWGLGTVLIFDNSRSHWNIELGYLETLKAFGRYIGCWYTLNQTFGDYELKKWQELFVDEVLAQLSVEEKETLKNKRLLNDILKKMRKLYNDRVTTEAISLYMLEFVAKGLGIAPTKLYSLESLLAEVQLKLIGDWQKVNYEEETMLLSLHEWLERYISDLPLPTERQQVIYIYRKLKAGLPTYLLLKLASLAPTVYLAAKTLIWLEEKALANSNQKKEK